MTEASVYADRIRETPLRVATLTAGVADPALPHRPGPGEWCAVEVAGHLADKFTVWRERVALTATADRPELEPYDQVAFVIAAG